ncbi:MAG: hypothetical protein AABX68_01985 [Nanoarchaeota archaeon]
MVVVLVLLYEALPWEVARDVLAVPFLAVENALVEVQLLVFEDVAPEVLLYVAHL